MRILIVGADGQLGSDLCKIIKKNEQIPLTIKDIDISDIDSVKKNLIKYKPNFVINTAAYHRVDDCEENDITAYNVNAHGVKNLAIICKESGSVLVHISTDYVFDGEKGSPYDETDIPDPRSAYGISKLAGEQFIKYLLDKYYIVRSCGLFGVAGCMGKGGGNFVEGMIKKAQKGEKIKVVTDEIVGPTFTYDLARKIVELINTNKFGLYHITNKGECSWWEFAEAIFKLSGQKVEVLKTTSSEFDAKAPRPKYSVLANKNISKIGLKPMRSWSDALKEYLQIRCG